MEKRINFNSCGCDDGCGGAGKKNTGSTKVVKGDKGDKGDPGLDSIVVASQIGNTGTDVPGNDSSAPSDADFLALKTDGFDAKAFGTLKSTQDTSVVTATKWFIRFSNKFIIYLATFPKRVLKAGGTTGQVPVKNSDADFDWDWETLSSLIKSDYYSLSTSNVAIALGNANFDVDIGLKYYPNMVCAATKADDPTQYMTGIVTAYNPTSGALTVSVKAIGGTGTFDNWILNVGFTPFLPDMTGKSGKFLTNDGVNSLWGNPTTLQPGDIVPSFRNEAGMGFILMDGSTYTYDPTSPAGPENPYRQLCINIGREISGSIFGKDAGGGALASNQFRLPDPKGRSLWGVGSTLGTPSIPELATVGGIGGVESPLLAIGQLPQHTHDGPSGNNFQIKDGVNVAPTTEDDASGDNAHPFATTGDITDWAISGQIVPGTQDPLKLEPKMAVYFYIAY